MPKMPIYRTAGFLREETYNYAVKMTPPLSYEFSKVERRRGGWLLRG
jgi:hypothetical protein